MKIVALFLSLFLAAPLAWAGGCRNFDTGERISWGDIPNIDDATALTISTWVNFDAVTSDQALVATRGASGDGFLFFMDDVNGARTDTFRLFLDEGGGASTADLSSASGAAVVGTWKHWAITFTANNASGLRMYVDGVEVGDSPASTSGVDNFGSTNNAVLFANDSAGGRDTDACLAYTYIYTRVLTDVEIQQEMFCPGSQGDGELFAPLWGTESPEINIASTTYTGTLVGTPTESADGPPIMLGCGAAL